MKKKDFESKSDSSLMKIKPSASLLTLKNNKTFCTKFFERHKITSLTDNSEEFDSSKALVYDLSRANNFEAQAFGTIIDLLMQLRAAGSDQNIFVQNNTVLREQILSQLKNEILRVSHKLTNTQIKSLEVISSNSFDEKTLTDILKSFLVNSKKKLADGKDAAGDFHVSSKSHYIKSEEISKNYLQVLSRTDYYEKTFDKILKNISYERLVHQIKSVGALPGDNVESSKEKTNLNHKALREILTEKFNINDVKVLEEVTRFYEKHVINRKGILPKIINLQSKISEINILTKANSFVENIVHNSLPKISSSKTQLVNKTFDSEKIDKLREDVIKNREEYFEDKTYHERNISRVYDEVRKIYGIKNFSQNITEILKSKDIKKSNVEENLKKNILRFVTKKDVVNRFKNIYEYAVENVSLKRVTDKNELINRKSVKYLDVEEKSVVKDITDLKHSNTIVDKRFTENIRRNQIFAKDIYVKRKNFKYIHKTLEKLNTTFLKEDNFKDTTLQVDLADVKHLHINDFENSLIKYNDIYSENIKKNILGIRRFKTKEIIENKIRKQIVSINEKELHERFKVVSDKSKLTFLNHECAVPLAITQTSDGQKVDVWNKEDEYRFIPRKIKENISDSEEIENIISKNIIRVLSPRVMRSKNFESITKDMYKKLIYNRINRYSEKSHDLNKIYHIKEKVFENKERYYDSSPRNYMIYKERERYISEEEKPKKSSEKVSEKKDFEPEIVIKEKPVKPEVIDTATIEKNIISKTLSQDDVVGLIQSYMKNINIDSISRAVIGRVERKLVTDRRRNGMF